MMVMPAVDILDHNVVQLVGGVRGTEQLVLPDPVQVARDWVGERSAEAARGRPGRRFRQGQ